MRIRISHGTRYAYGLSPKRVIQTLRLTPRNHDGQYVVRWRIDVSEDCRLARDEDAFGNLTHTFSIDGPLTELNLLVTGEVETEDSGGLVRGTVERLPPALYLRETDLTRADAAIRDFARATAAGAAHDRLALLHTLLGALHREIVFDTDPTHATTTAAEAFALKRGVCQDITHVFVACARHLGIPARYVGGYFHRADGVTAQEAGHAWAEAHVAGLGWVGFDPANGICITDAHVRVASGLDYLGAAPVRGTRYGGGGELMSIAVHVDQAASQMQA